MTSLPSASPSPQPSELSSRTLHGVHYIKLPSAIVDSQLPEMISTFKAFAALPVEMHVIDFGKLTKATSGFYRLIQTFEVQLKTRNLKMLSINIDESISDQIHQMSLQATFNQTREKLRANPNVKSVFNEAKNKKTLFKYLVNAAHEAVQLTLQSTLSCDENYFSKVELVPYGDIDLISYVTVNNDFVKCEFRLLASKAVITKLAQAMLGPEQELDDELLESMAQELLNMIYGHAKSNLNDKELFRLPSAIPQILRKPDFEKVKRSKPPVLTVMPMVTPLGSFYIEIDFGSV